MTEYSTEERADRRDPENRPFERGVVLALVTLTLTVLGIAWKGGEALGEIRQRLQSLEASTRVDMTPGAEREISALKARQDMDDRHRTELLEQMRRIEEQQREILKELRSHR